jgi:hypothetical protein
MREETIAQQNAERISPARIGGRLSAASLRFIHHIVMHKGGDVDELNDDGKVDVVRVDLARSAAGEKRQNRPKAFATTPDCIHNIALQRRIECRRLLCNSNLYLFKMRLNQPRDFSQRTGR